MAVLITSSVDGSIERRILIALITSKSVLGRIASKWDGKMFRSSVSNTVANLCVTFYRKHSDAPGKAIDSLYDSWAEGQHDQRLVEEIGRFLNELGGEYQQLAEGVNAEHVIDIAGKHFRMVKLEALRENIDSAIAAHDEERGGRFVSEYRKLELGVGCGINVTTDKEEMKALFNREGLEVLVNYRGALGEFFANDLSRDSLVAFWGPDKSSKSFFIQDLAWRLMCERRKVAYFECGDLSKSQILSRFMVRAAQHPIISTNLKKPLWPCEVKYPIKMDVHEDEQGRRRAFITKTSTKTFDKPLDFETAWKACERVMKTEVRSKKPFLKLSVHPNDSVSVDTIRSVLDDYAAEDFYPDALIIDYPDIMAWPHGCVDERAAINKTWKQLRALSQELHALVAVVTQSDADAYGKEVITRKNFSGDKRKLAHVTATYAINITDDEKERGTCRLNCIVRREGSFVSNKFVHVAQCLALGKPAVLSSF